jgi:hypothetical protein
MNDRVNVLTKSGASQCSALILQSRSYFAHKPNDLSHRCCCCGDFNLALILTCGKKEAQICSSDLMMMLKFYYLDRERFLQERMNATINFGLTIMSGLFFSEEREEINFITCMRRESSQAGSRIKQAKNPLLN